MTIFMHEMKRGKISLIIWTAILAFMLSVCVFIYPEMSAEMAEMGDMFSEMGAFSEAFGMDQLNFGEFIGYFGIECGNVLGLGGAFFAAILGISMLLKEEKEHTAEFLLAHPIPRTRIVLEKMLAILAQVAILNFVVSSVTMLATWAIGEDVPFGKMLLIFLAYFILQIEIAAITFGISAFLRRGGLAIGLGISVAFYFLNIIANLTDNAEFLKYITPFGYADSASIIADGTLDATKILVGLLFGLAGIVCGYFQYDKKDIL